VLPGVGMAILSSVGEVIFKLLQLQVTLERNVSLSCYFDANTKTTQMKNVIETQSERVDAQCTTGHIIGHFVDNTDFHRRNINAKIMLQVI